MTKPIMGFRITSPIPNPIHANEPFIHRSLPTVLIIKILCALNPEVLIKSCRGVCRLWHEIADQVPSKFWMPKEYWAPANSLSPAALDTVQQRLVAAKVRKLRKVFDQKPVRTRPSPFEIPTDQAFCWFKYHGFFDSFANSCSPLLIVTEGNYPPTYDGIRKTYIKVFKSNELTQDWDPVNTIECSHREEKFLRNVNSILCEDFLMLCFRWADTRSGEASALSAQCLIVQYVTGYIIVDSELPNQFSFSEKFLAAVKRYPFLIGFKRTRTGWVVNLANNSEMISLKYLFEPKTITGKRSFLDTTS
jgi:hypothetical protein